MSFNLYSAEWKKNILGPLHKSVDKCDPKNFSNFLGKHINKCERDIEMQKYVAENIGNLDYELDITFKKTKLLYTKRKFKNDTILSFNLYSAE